MPGSIRKIMVPFSSVGELLAVMNPSAHLLEERRSRINRVEGTTIRDAFEVADSTKCKYGPVQHLVTEKAEDFIVSMADRKLITVLCCRPHQLDALYRGVGLETPKPLAVSAWLNHVTQKNK